MDVAMLPFFKFFKVSSMKHTCLVLLVVTVGSIAWWICHMLAAGRQGIMTTIASDGHWAVWSSDSKMASLLEEHEYGHREQKSKYLLWKTRLKEKWERHKKQQQQQQSDSDNYTNGTFIKYVDLSPAPSWDLDSLWDYFSDTPSCRQQPHGQEPLLLILVTSSPGNFDRRLAIRKAWSAQLTSRTTFQTVFLLGRAQTEVLETLVDNEMRQHSDILRGNYCDSYRNLTLKVLHGLTFASRECEAKYVLKTDDDCFVNVPLIQDFLERHNRRSKTLYVGKVLSQSQTKVIRNPGNKWHVPRHLYPPDFYPPYPSGHGYIISHDLLEKLLNASSRLLPFPNEDAYVGVLMNAIGVQPISTQRFTLYNFRWRICNLLYLMVIHHIGPEEQSSLVDMALKAKQQCPGQAEVTDW